MTDNRLKKKSFLRPRCEIAVKNFTEFFYESGSGLQVIKPDLNFLVLTWKAETDVRKTVFSKYIIYIPGWKLLDLVYQQQNERRHHHFLTRPMHGTEILDHKWVHYSPPPLPNKTSFHYFSIFLSLTRHFQQFFRIPDCVLLWRNFDTYKLTKPS